MMTSDRTCCGWVGVWAAAGAIASAVLTAIEGRRAGSLQDGVFAALVVCWSCSPYLATYVCCRVALPPHWVRPATYGVFAYAAVDASARWHSLHAPSNASDAVGLLLLPVWSPLIIVTAAVIAMALSSVAIRSWRGIAVR